MCTISSTIKNMNFIKEFGLAGKYDFIIQNSIPLPIYVDKYYEKDIIIKIKKYESFYNFLGAMNNDTFSNYKSLINNILNSNDIYFDELFPMNFRINTDLLMFNQFCNFYLHNLNIIIYIKKIFGNAEIYQCELDYPIDINNLLILTKPFTECKNKKSLFNTIFNTSSNK